MFQVGQIFKRDGYELCVLDIVNYNNKYYIFTSVEKEKIEFLFYEVEKHNTSYALKKVSDDMLEAQLFSIVDNNVK